jgi:CRP-like cAMP-binding protein
MLSDLGVKYFAEWAVRMKAGAKSVKLSPQQPILLGGRKVSPKFYLVDFGNCRSASGLTFGPGEWFGEESLLGEGEYFTSIYSNSPVMLLELDANLMLQILNENSVAGRALTEVIRKKSRLRNALTLTKLFADLQVSASLVDGIALDISLERFPAGETVFRKGQVDEGHMFIIDSGVLRIDLGRNRQFEKGKNEMVGDIVASGAQSTRSADIQAVTPATLIKLPRLTFQKLLEDVRIYRRFQEIVSQYERVA